MIIIIIATISSWPVGKNQFSHILTRNPKNYKRAKLTGKSMHAN
jgi:hypothetical protein